MKPVKSTDLSVGANRLLAMQSSIKNKDIGVGLRSHPDKTAQAMQLPVRFCIIPELPKGRSHLSVTGAGVISRHADFAASAVEQRKTEYAFHMNTASLGIIW